MSVFAVLLLSWTVVPAANSEVSDSAVVSRGEPTRRAIAFSNATKSKLMRRENRKARPKGMVGLDSLGGKSFHVVWAHDGKMHLDETDSLSLAQSPGQDVADKSLDMTFEDWAKTAPWTDKIQLMKELVPFLEMEHPVPLKPKVLIDDARVTDEDCQAVGEKDGSSAGVFSGSRPLGQQPFAIDVSMFGFDLDVMEVKLHELNQTVDLFCIIEMPVAHHGQAKPLLWARNMKKPRFAAFRDKILHVVVELSDLGPKEQDQVKNYSEGKPTPRLNWGFESEQELIGLAKIRDAIRGLLAKAAHASTRPIVMSFGDADEIASPRNWKLMKACQPHQPLDEQPIDNAAMMSFGQFKRPFQSDHPVSGLRYSFGNPTFHDPMSTSKRNRGYGTSGKHLLGGWHMTSYAYPPYMVIKSLTATELRGTLNEATVQTLRRNVWEVQFGTYHANDRRTIPIEQLERMEPYVSHPDVLKPPAIVRQNPERYEAWFEKKDRRLQLMPASQVSGSRASGVKALIPDTFDRLRKLMRHGV